MKNSDINKLDIQSIQRESTDSSFSFNEKLYDFVYMVCYHLHKKALHCHNLKGLLSERDLLFHSLLALLKTEFFPKIICNLIPLETFIMNII